MKYQNLLLISALYSGLTFSAPNNLGCDNVIKFSDFKGMTYLSFMQEVVKPTLDEYATDGYVLKGKRDISKALSNVSSKVSRAAVSAAGSKEKLLEIAEELDGQTTNLYELPDLIASVKPGVNRFKLATFFGLVSCGGAIIEYAPGHIAYNIHYGTGENDKDDRTGRSFGEGDARSADDASDKNYLKDLEEFGTEHSTSMDQFYKTLVSSLADSNPTGFTKISDHGKTLLTDFLAVYTAEQARNLMDGKISVHWDAALLEVTLLEAFHAGQDEIKLFYKDPYTGEVSFTNTVYNQDTGCSETERSQRSARVYDYWQFSASNDPSHCKRSGINITKREFRKLAEKITTYEKEHNPELVQSILEHIGSSSIAKKNVFYGISKFFINSNTEKSLGSRRSRDLASDFVAFLGQVKKDAMKITALIEKGEL